MTCFMKNPPLLFFQELKLTFTTLSDLLLLLAYLFFCLSPLVFIVSLWLTSMKLVYFSTFRFSGFVYFYSTSFSPESNFLAHNMKSYTGLWVFKLWNGWLLVFGTQGRRADSMMPVDILRRAWGSGIICRFSPQFLGLQATECCCRGDLPKLNVATVGNVSWHGESVLPIAMNWSIFISRCCKGRSRWDQKKSFSS